MATNFSDYALFSDLDRTLIPNGEAPENAQARNRFSGFIRNRGMHVVYVSGRRLTLLQQAVEQFGLPLPNYAVGDVGSSVFHIVDNEWRVDLNWQQTIAKDWNQVSASTIIQALEVLGELQLQEPEAQSVNKISYYTPEQIDRDGLFASIHDQLRTFGLNISLVWSHDEQKNCGLLDILPASATKLNAIIYVAQQLQIPLNQCLFAGDSGNDLSVIGDGRIRSILVANAADVVKQEAADILARKQLSQQLYIAKGGYQGMNGNYSAGVLEGVDHYFNKS